VVHQTDDDQRDQRHGHADAARDRRRQLAHDPSSSLPGGDYPGQNGNQQTYEFDAPKLDEGADGIATYAMPDDTYFQTLSQDDLNGGASDELASPSCVDPYPTNGQPQYTCAATFGESSASFPWDPSRSNFTPFFNFRDNYAGAPSGARPAQVVAVGQTCNTNINPGDSFTCTGGQPSMTNFSPVDPDNYMLLQFVNRGPEPTTVTIIDPWMVAMQQQYPGGTVYLYPTAQTRRTRA
jgi:hypothetical protein